MKYVISWSEKSPKSRHVKANSLVEAFEKIYGVKEFIITSKKLRIMGSHFLLVSDNYDLAFNYMINCFLTKRQIIKFYRSLCHAKS